MEWLSGVRTLPFDLFGTILDLGGSLTPAIARFLQAQGAPVAPDRFWDQWRARQRIEQYQDNILRVTANSFDVLGARACGLRGAFLNRYGLPYEDTPYQPDITVRDFTELADRLAGSIPTVP